MTVLRGFGRSVGLSALLALSLPAHALFADDEARLREGRAALDSVYESFKRQGR